MPPPHSLLALKRGGPPLRIDTRRWVSASVLPPSCSCAIQGYSTRHSPFQNINIAACFLLFQHCSLKWIELSTVVCSTGQVGINFRRYSFVLSCCNTVRQRTSAVWQRVSTVRTLPKDLWIILRPSSDVIVQPADELHLLNCSWYFSAFHLSV
jgi:hypothetical protein